LINESTRTGKPLSFVSTGQQIPEDLEAADRDQIVATLLAGMEDEAC
jgi:flagellar biosynthesis GTPase FlhF